MFHSFFSFLASFFPLLVSSHIYLFIFVFIYLCYSCCQSSFLFNSVWFSLCTHVSFSVCCVSASLCLVCLYTCDLFLIIPCCSIPQLNTLRVTQYAPTPIHVQVQEQSFAWEHCLCNRFQLPRHVVRRTQSSEDLVSLSGGWSLLCQQLTMTEYSHHATRHNNFLL